MQNPYLELSTDDEPRLKVLLDADVLLELFINRSGFVEDVEKLLAEIEKSRQVEVYVTDKCLKRIGLEEGLGENAALYVEKIFCGRVIKISKSIRDEARTYCLPDFDSAEEVVCAKNEQLNAIVTQNIQNFDGTNNLLIWSIESLLATLQLNKNLSIQYEEKELVNYSSGIASLTRHLKAVIIDACHPVKITSLGGIQYYIDFAGVRGRKCCPSPVLINLEKREKINSSWNQEIRFDNYWLTSDEALLLFRNHYSLLGILEENYIFRIGKNRIGHTIYSLKYLHKYLLEVLLYKFPKKNVNNYYDLPFYDSPHQLQLGASTKLSLTIALNAG
jgi:hypothetical protein